jgi:hypothetical protein
MLDVYVDQRRDRLPLRDALAALDDAFFEQGNNCTRNGLDLRDSCGELLRVLDLAAELLNEIVVTVGEDRGVILKSDDSPTQYDAERKCQVYLHENFSPLGDALVKLADLISEPISAATADHG